MHDLGRLLVQLFDGLGMGIAIVDRDLRYMHVNRALAAINERPVVDHIGRKAREVIPPSVAESVLPRIRRVLETGEAVVDAPLTTQHAEGPRHWTLSHVPLRDRGEVVAVGVILVDVTEGRVTAERLRANEAQFRSICETAPVGIFLTDAAGNGIYANPANLAQMGLSPEEARGVGWQKAIHPEDLSHVTAAFRGAVDRGETYDGVNRYLRPDGSVVWVDVLAQAIREGDQIVGYLGITQDISERRRAEAALRQRELELRQLADNIGAVFWLAKIESYEPVYVSSAFHEVWGRPPEVILGSFDAFVQTVHPEDRPILERSFADRPLETTRELEYRVVRPDGSIVWILDRFFPLRDETGRAVRMAGLATDITARKALEAQAREAQKLDSIGRLAGGVAHDFNNLLTVVMSQVALARRAIDNGRSATEELAQIEEAATHAAALTRRLLAFARRGHVQLSFVDPGDLLAEVEQLLRRVIGEQIRLETVLEPDLGVVRVDRVQLEQVLVNLAINARDAMPDGGVLRIETENVTTEGRRYVVIRVRDTGRGIPEEHRAHLFEPFFTTNPFGGGTGLGLATCYGIVTQLGGRITVDSAVGRGSTFSVYLPRVDGVADAPPQEVSAPAPRGVETVLLVEDDDAVRDVAARALREHGFEVLTAADGAEALRVIEREADRVDIVVTDVVMPVLGGRELAARVHDRRPGVPVLFTSGYVEEEAEPVAPFLAKPYVPDTLARRVRDVLDGAG